MDPWSNMGARPYVYTYTLFKPETWGAQGPPGSLGDYILDFVL